MMSSSSNTERISASSVAKSADLQRSGCTKPRPAGSGMTSSLGSIWIVIGRWRGLSSDHSRMSARHATNVGQVER
jgi:hypothetical protein